MVPGRVQYDLSGTVFSLACLIGELSRIGLVIMEVLLCVQTKVSDAGPYNHLQQNGNITSRAKYFFCIKVIA